jgi:hypothetical protein
MGIQARTGLLVRRLLDNRSVLNSVCYLRLLTALLDSWIFRGLLKFQCASLLVSYNVCVELCWS